MRLLLFGASGKTGRTLLPLALAAGHRVTAFTRDRTRITLADPGLAVVQGNVADAPTIAAVLPGHDAVISCLGVGTPLHHDADVIAGVDNIVRAMPVARVRRLVYVSFIGVRESRNAVGFLMRYLAPIPLRREISDHEAKERIVRASGLEWTIVRPPKLTDGPRTGRVRSGDSITTLHPLPSLSRADLAEFILGELAHPAFVGRAVRLLH